MEAERAERRQALATRLSGVAALIVIAIGAVVLIGWTTGLETPKRVLPGMVAMNPMSATLFILAGLSLWLQRFDAAPGRKRVARLLAGVVMLIAAIKLATLVAGLDASVDSVLFADRLVDGVTQFPNRMAPNTAAIFLAMGLALWMIDRTTIRARRPAELLAAIVAMLSLLALLDYLYRVGSMYGISRYIPMALHTAAGFLLLAMGLLLARPREGWMAVATGPGPGGAMARLMLPGMMVLLVVIGWLRLQAEQLGWVDLHLAVSFYTGAFIMMSAGLIAVGALSLDRAGAAQIRAVAQREQAFAELQRNEARTRSIIDTARDAFISINAGGLVTEWNAAAEHMFGWTRNESLGCDPLHRFIPEIQHQAYRNGLHQQAGADAPSIFNQRMEITALRRNGTEFPIEMSIWPQQSGDSPGFNAFIRDITESKQAEAEIHALNADLVANANQLELSNRELESFSYSISHDLRAPLRHIGGYALMLQEDAAPQLDADARRYLDEIGTAARRMGILIDDLLAFSRLSRTPVERIAVDMRQLLEQALHELSGGPDPRVEIGPLPAAAGDPALLRQVWVNLLSNALKYSAPRGDGAKITITGASEGDYVCYKISDNGVGFDRRYADKLFGVFRRLHSNDEFEGTGVGLAIVQRIVSRHGGTVSATAELDRGATFTFQLPAPSVTDTLQITEPFT